MADAQVDHPGEVTWYAGHGPAPVLGPCPHDCEHLSVSEIAWGPDLEHYALVACVDSCGGQCRGWWRERPPGHAGPYRRLPLTWLQVAAPVGADAST